VINNNKANNVPYLGDSFNYRVLTTPAIIFD